MAYTAGSTGTGTTGSLRSDLVDLSGVSLDELREVSGLPEAFAALRGRLADGSAPLCQSEMTPPCGGAARAQSGSRP
ncbi:hypothetical protein [Streptomyces hiroshimensis]|nr:hypothetical protein [Streptomyces hiroshimensis]